MDKQPNHKAFPSRLRLRIDWSEMDMFGHVNNVAYFKYIQASRVNYWEISGLYQFFTEQKLGPILLSTGCRFIKPVHYPGQITILARVEFIKNTSFGIYHQIISDIDNSVAAEANDVIVMFDFSKNEKIPVPDSFRQKVAQMEG
jgi:acyl-CoA thioester hydrolase